jgi:hypothetical protein
MQGLSEILFLSLTIFLYQKCVFCKFFPRDYRINILRYRPLFPTFVNIIFCAEGRIRVCRETIQWATKDNRNYLRSATRLFSLLSYSRYM